MYRVPTSPGSGRKMASNQSPVKPWAGRFTEGTDQIVEQFTESVSFDQRLYRQDIRGSLAHVRMLAHCGVLSQDEAGRIAQGLDAVLADIEEIGRASCRERV